MGFWIKRYIDFEKKLRIQEKEEFYQKIQNDIALGYQNSQKDDDTIKEDITGVKGVIESLKAGLLSVQGRQFKEDCKKLLAEEHTITFDEYQQIVADHAAYKSLGGNHNGDALFNLVVKKAEVNKIDISEA